MAISPDAGRPPEAATPVYRPSLLSRLISGFSGPVGLVVKVALLAITDALAIWAASVLADQKRWLPFGVLVIATVLINLVYFWARRAIPLKFLTPGLVLLFGFQIIPIVYTVNIAFTNYSTGHVQSKSETVAYIQQNSLEQGPEGHLYTMTPARDVAGNLALLLVNQDTNDLSVGTATGQTPLDPKTTTVSPDTGAITAAPGYTPVPANEVAKLDATLTSFKVPTSDGAIQPQGFDSAADLSPTLRYDAARDEFVRLKDNVVFADNGKGSFVAPDGEELEPGWTDNVGLYNFNKLWSNPAYRDPFLRVLVWTIVFASLTVLFSFTIGLLLAISLNKAGMRFQKTYRSIMVIPYAIPGFLSLLVWRGLLNDDFGVVNNLLGTSIPWLFGENWARVSVLIVSTWLTFPYFFLVAMGALQAIPAELTEAAEVDGGNRRQIFRRVTLPLLLVATAPLLIASFAYNFNNFGNIYLLTGGGPAAADQSVAGATDILISYTYKLAFESGKGSDLGLASAVSIVIFFIVAAISGIGFWRTNSLEDKA
jgi:arabinogalactan oligomer/maltooligosaccharide transport system permease protein